MKIGEYLIKKQYITAEELHIALNEANASRGLLGDCLVRLGFLRWQDLEKVLREIAPEALIDTTGQMQDHERTLPRDFCIATKTIFKGDLGDSIAIATWHKDPEYIRKEATKLTGKEVILVSASYSELESHLSDDTEGLDITDSLSGVEDANQIISSIIHESMKNNVSDVHIESTGQTIHIRYRIDGILRSQHVLPSNIMERLFTRIKDRAGMDVSERRKPQDGSFSETYKGRSIDFRVATIPTANDEKINMRILDKDRVMVDIRDIGLTGIDDWLYLSQQTNGLILVCGATGSGKTTTLYSTIMSLDRIHKSIYTIEDPIEYRLPCITQVQINPHVGFGFAQALRSFLRLDPDIIIVGEIRDEETAENAIHTADTGHLVYATMHTNDIPSTISRLQNLKINLEQVSYCLRGIIVQRLVRKLCTNCHGKGCPSCNHNGYKGRTLISEFARINGPEDMEKLISREGSYQTFEDDAKLKITNGSTDCQEISRVMNKDIRLCGGTGICHNQIKRQMLEHEGKTCTWSNI